MMDCKKLHFSPYLPDPFLKRNGSGVQYPEEWLEQAQYLKELAQKYMYGQWPGSPKSLAATEVDKHTEYQGQAVSETIDLLIDGQTNMRIELLSPANVKQFPVIVNNENLSAMLNSGVPADGYKRGENEKQILAAGYALATFAKETIRPDHPLRPEEIDLYPKLNCGTIMAWGWAQSVVAEYLCTRDDVKGLIATGCSRNGKAALCSGIFQERFDVVAPICSGCGGAGSARFLGTVDGKRQDEARCETVGSLAYHFPHWFTEAYAQFGSKEEPFPVGETVNYFPIDAHILRVLCAPRAVFCSEGEDDQWANAFGTQLARDAAQKVFDFLGVPEKNGFHIRKGGHGFYASDWSALLDFCDVMLGRRKTFEKDDTVKPYFNIVLKDYAPWA